MFSQSSVYTKFISAIDKINPLIQFLSERLTDLIRNNESVLPIQKINTVFDAIISPDLDQNIGLQYENFLLRMMVYGVAPNTKDLVESLENYIFSVLVNMEKTLNRNNLGLTTRNIHRFILASFRVTNKFMFDDYYDNQTFAKIGGVTHKEMNKLENEFLILNGYNLATQPEDIANIREEYKKWLSSHADKAKKFVKKL